MRAKRGIAFQALRAVAGRWSSTASPGPRMTAAKVPAEVAHLVSRRHIGMVDMRPEMKDALDTFILGSGLRGRRLRLIGRRLTDHLKAISQTEARGGILGWMAVESRKKQEKRVKALRQQRQELKRLVASSSNLPAALSDSLGPGASFAGDSLASSVHDLVASNEHRGYLQQPHHSSFAQPHSTKPGVIQEVPVLSYEEVTAAAYAATRLPGCFAAAIRVFDELKERMPTDFKPKKMLDLGAGPGTAIWAAREVWEDNPQEVLAVEPSWPMVNLAQQLETSLRESGAMAACRVRWMSRLPALHGSNSRQKRRYDLVVASYVLSEVPEESERWRMVRDLWERTGDVLVLIEPGTPVGSANIQEARTRILQQERKREKKQLESLTCTTGEVMDVGDPIAVHRLKQAGCHIVAPCPHDGPCPMADKKMWCHFNQRFLRTRAQKVTKIVPGHAWGPRDFQDERFSYVAFRRGKRKSLDDGRGLDIRVEEDFIVPPDDLEVQFTPAQHPGWRQAESDRQTSKVSTEDEVNRPSAQRGSEIQVEDLLAPRPLTPMDLDLANLDADTRALILNSIMGDDAEDDQDSNDEAVDVSQLEDVISRLQGVEDADIGDEIPDSGRQGLQMATSGDLGWADTGGEISDPGAQTNRLQMDTEEGLGGGVSKTLGDELPSEGRDCEGLPTAYGTSDLGSSGAGVHHQGQDRNTGDETAVTSGALVAAAHSQGPHSLQPFKSASELGVIDGREVDWEELAPDMVSATKAASRRWSRIIRPPRKRSGHVILDVCVAAGDGSGGKLQRHIISRADKETFIGPAGYKIAMKSSWGDLWPTYYNTNYKIRDV